MSSSEVGQCVTLANLTGGAKSQDDRRLAFSGLHMEEELTPAEVAALNLLAAKHLKYEKHCASSSAALLPSKDAMSKRDALWETFAPVMRDVDDAPPPAGRAERPPSLPPRGAQG